MQYRYLGWDKFTKLNRFTDACGLIQKLLRLDPDRLPLDKVRYLILIIYVGKVVWYLSLDGIGILVRYGTLPTSNGAALVFPLNSEAQKRVPETQGCESSPFSAGSVSGKSEFLKPDPTETHQESIQTTIFFKYV